MWHFSLPHFAAVIRATEQTGEADAPRPCVWFCEAEPPMPQIHAVFCGIGGDVLILTSFFFEAKETVGVETPRRRRTAFLWSRRKKKLKIKRNIGPVFSSVWATVDRTRRLSGSRAPLWLPSLVCVCVFFIFIFLISFSFGCVFPV